MTPDELHAIALSLGVAAAATAIDLPLALVLGTWFARRRGTPVVLVEAVVMMPLVLPPVVTGYGLLLLFGPRGLGLPIAFTPVAAVLAAAVVALPLFVRAVRHAIAAVDPGLVAAARSLGASPWTAWRRVVLPLALPGVLGGALLAFARALGEFGATAVFAGSIAGRTRTVPLAIFGALQQVDDGGTAGRLALAAVGLSLLCALAAELIARRRS
jgi:molybdate transport system permease protein